MSIPLFLRPRGAAARRLAFLLSLLGAIGRAGLAAAAGGQSAAHCCDYVVTGNVWYDQNGNGIKEGSEPPLGGWTVRVFDASNVLVGTTTTNAGGVYSFNAPVGCGLTFKLKQVVQSGWNQTFPTANGFHTSSGTGCEGEVFGPFNFGNKPQTCAPLTKVYTTDPDFNLGTLNGVVTNSNQLELSVTPTTWPYAWIANSGEGTISKVDTQTGNEVGRYYTGPPDGFNSFSYLFPSRTVIDKDGNCWVANRTSGNARPSVAQIVTTGGDDRNNNSNIETSTDLNSDGDCADPGELLPWGADERVKRHYEVGNTFNNAARGMVIDKTGFLWVGLSFTQTLHKLNPNLPIATYAPNQPPSVAPSIVTISTGKLPYGLALSPNGLIYQSTLSNWALEIDPGVASGGTGAGPAVTDSIDHGGGNYGIAVDRNCIVWLALTATASAGYGCVRWDPPLTAGNPANGWTISGPGAPGIGRGITVDFNNNVWMACNDANNSVVRFNNTPTPTVFAVYPTPAPTPCGVGVSSDANIIVTPNGGSLWCKLNSTNGALMPLAGPQLAGPAPYTYSDFTGSLQSLTSLQQGTWNVITDGGSNAFLWNFVGWTPSTPPGTSVQVEARVAQTLPALGAASWTTIGTPGPLGSPMAGRYIENRVRLTRAVEGCSPPFVTPILYDLTVGGICDTCDFAYCPHDTTIACQTAMGAVLEYPVPLLENICAASYQFTCSPPSGTMFPIGTTPVTCNAVSALGDTVKCKFNVTVLPGCNPTPTGACCLQTNCIVATEAACAQQGGIYFGNGSNCTVGCNYKCIPPPNHMAGWWKLDPSSAPGSVVTRNTANPGIAAILVNDPTPLAGENVDGAYGFDGSSQYVEIAHHADFDFGTGDLSIDAWIKTSAATGVEPIVDKRATSPVQGYSFYLDDGFPALQLAVGGVPRDFSLHGLPVPGAFVADGSWHLVAVAVDRDSPDGIRFYVDGQPVGPPLDPTVSSGSLDNTAALYLARSHPIPLSSRYFNGALDEVEIIHDVISPAKVAQIHQAGVVGKCPELCYATENVPCCNGLSNTSSVTICNYDVVSHVYSYGLSAINGGPGCAAVGPTSFTPATGTVTVPAGGCVNVPILIGCPSNIPIGQVACYQVSLFNHDTGRLFACHGSVRRPIKWCMAWTLPDPVGVVGVTALAEGGTTTFNLKIGNLDSRPNPATLDYQVRAFAGHDDDPSRTVRLNGLPPGEPVFGTRVVHGGETATVPIQIDYPMAWLIGYDRIVVYGDEDGDGVSELLSEMAVRGVPSEVVGVSDPAPGAAGGLETGRLFLAVPNPFGAAGRIRFRVTEKADVKLRLFDLAGRTVKIFYMERRFEAGEYGVDWNSVDDRGERLWTGLYFLKLEVGKRSESVKIVVRR